MPLVLDPELVDVGESDHGATAPERRWRWRSYALGCFTRRAAIAAAQRQGAHDELYTAMYLSTLLRAGPELVEHRMERVDDGQTTEG